MLEDNEYVEIEGRQYGSPQLIIDESNQFIDNLRATQQANTQQIAEQTADLGTEIPSSLGGLTGGESYWTSRLQIPQTNATVANLRATAQAAALNQALANEQAVWQKRYQDAYRAYQKRQYDASKTPQTTTGGGNTLDVDTNANANEKVELDVNTPGAGEIIPNTNYVSDYQDTSTGQWYQLTSPREIDVIAANNSLAGRSPSDGTVVTVPSGRTLRYVAAKNEWYEQTNSAGPNTYSPRAW